MRGILAIWLCGWLACVASASTFVTAPTRADDYEYNVMPGNAKVEPWCYAAANYGYKIGVAFKGNSVYVQGVERNLPKDVIKGTVTEGDTVVFNNRQLLGFINERYRVYFLLMEQTDEGLVIADNDRKLHMKLDREKQEMTTIEEDSDLIVAFNYSLTQINFISRWINPAFKYQDTFEGTPKNPFNLYFTTDCYSLYGYNGFSVCLPTVDSNGNVLLLEDLYYRLYLNGELMTFYGDEYNSLPGGVEELEMMPYEYTNSFDVNITPENASIPSPINHHIGIYPDGIEEVGVQSVYMHDGVTTVSDIVMLDVATGEVSAINASVPSLATDMECVSVDYFNLTGKSVSNPSSGIFVEVIRCSDGSSITRKKVIR